MIAKEGAEGDRKHGGDEEEEENVELAVSLTCSNISPKLQHFDQIPRQKWLR